MKNARQILEEFTASSFRAGPSNPELQAQNPDSMWPPDTDSKSLVPTLKYPFAFANKRVYEGGWSRTVPVEVLFALAKSEPGVTAALKLFFAVVELLIIGAGIYVFRKRKELFGYHGKEGDTYASANLRLAMVVLIWIHSVILTAIMIFEV